MSVSSVFFDYFPLGKNAKKVKANHGAATWGRGGAHTEVHRIISGGFGGGRKVRRIERLSDSLRVLTCPQPNSAALAKPLFSASRSILLPVTFRRRPRPLLEVASTVVELARIIVRG